MTPLEALIVLREYKDLPYKAKAAQYVCSQANKVLTEEATRLMQEQTRGLCTKCWGDGFHRISGSMLSGPCESCNGSGRSPADVGGASNG